MVYAKFGGQTECIMGNSKIENVETSENWVDISISTRKTDKFVLLVLMLMLKS